MVWNWFYFILFCKHQNQTALPMGHCVGRDAILWEGHSLLCTSSDGEHLLLEAHLPLGLWPLWCEGDGQWSLYCCHSSPACASLWASCCSTTQVCRGHPASPLLERSGAALIKEHVLPLLEPLGSHSHQQMIMLDSGGQNLLPKFSARRGKWTSAFRLAFEVSDNHAIPGADSSSLLGGSGYIPPP